MGRPGPVQQTVRPTANGPSVEEVRAVLDDGPLWTVFQPIYGLDDGDVVGVEALTRFAGPHGPAGWFARAHRAGLGVDLELAALTTALAAAATMPAGARLWVNLSPAALVDPRTLPALSRGAVADLGVEVTEQSPVTGYPALRRQREALAELGIRVAVDDVGGGQASRRHVAFLRPDVVKIDRSVTSAMERGRFRRVGARDLVRRVRRQAVTVVAEGVETPAQLARWQRLGVDAVQGFFLATPSSLEQALRVPPIGARPRG